MISMHELTNRIGIDDRRRGKNAECYARTRVRTTCVYIRAYIYAILRAYACRGWALN